MTDNNCEIRAGRWESAQDIKIFHSGARNPRRRLGNDQRLISVEKLSRSSNPSSTLSMNLPAKVTLSKKSPILDPVQEILISIMISRGPWSNEGAAIDLENAQDRPVTGAPLLEM